VEVSKQLLEEAAVAAVLPLAHLCEVTELEEIAVKVQKVLQEHFDEKDS
jgi:tRNA(Ser,Leu) C12 N-acetylase TAN1